MSTKLNNCLLRALMYYGATLDCCDDDEEEYRALRKRVAAFMLKNRDATFNDMCVKDWVYQTAKLDVETWAHRFAEANEMSDQIVLFIWPYMMKEPVCVWQPCDGGFEHLGAFHFTTPGLAETCCRHVVYRPDEVHYNALQVVRPGAISEGPLPNSAVVRRHGATPFRRSASFPECLPFAHVGRWIRLVADSVTSASRAPHHMLRKRVHLLCTTTVLI